MQKFSTLKPAAMLVVQENTTEAALWINLLYITISSLPSAFGRVFKGVFTIKEDSTYSTWKRVSNCSNFHRRWCFQGFGVSTREVMKFKVTYFTCPALCFQSPVSLNIEGIKVPGELLRFQFQVLFQPPQAAPPWNTMSNIHITLCFSAAFLPFANSCNEASSLSNCVLSAVPVTESLESIRNTENHASIS